ncbi:MAG TPA: helix-turn-helix domain-containing protein [Iamia sp.]|jgi:DNA-binding NarL/FixJ family response regulator|nr:helix-turn-helix domain-containing protein [Iamia sp.]
MPYLLEPVGLERADNDVYLALVVRPSASVAVLAEATTLPVDAVEISLARLADEGLVIRDEFASPRYRAISPDEAIPALIARRRSQLVDLQRSVDAIAETARTRATDDRAAVAERIPPADLVDVVMGLQAGAQREMLIVAAPPYLDGQVWPNDGELSALERGVAYRVVYHPDSLASPEQLAHVRRCAEAGEDARILADAGPKMVIVDRSAAIVVESSAHPDAAARLLVRPSSLLDLLVDRFQRQWSAAVPVAGADDAAADVSERDRELLALLAAGLKDRAIAHTLGVTERTIGRRVTDLMERLDAATRFRAGARAAQRGWIPPE